MMNQEEQRKIIGKLQHAERLSRRAETEERRTIAGGEKRALLEVLMLCTPYSYVVDDESLEVRVYDETQRLIIRVPYIGEGMKYGKA